MTTRAAARGAPRGAPAARPGQVERPPRWRGALPLAGVAVVVVVLAASGVLPLWPGLVHLVALPPLDLHADLRLLLVHAPSWPVAVGGLLVVLAVRVLVLASLLGGVTRRTVRRAALLYAVVVVSLLLAAFVQTAAAAVLYSRLFWPGLALLGIVVLLAAAVAWQDAGDGPGRKRGPAAWRRAWRAGLRVDVVVPYLLVVVGLGMLAHVLPATTLALVPLSAMATAVAARRLRRPPRVRPALALAATVVAVGAAAAVLVLTRPDGAQPPDGPPQEGSVLIMSGINSSSGQGAIFDIRPQRLGYACDQTYYFSYAGPGDGQPQGGAQCEIRTGAPYEPDDTQRPFAEQVAVFEEQTADLPRPITVLAHSHAVWVAWEAMAAGDAEVDVLVLVGPFPDNPVGWAREGRGSVLGDLLRWTVPAADLVDFNFDPDAPAAQELLAEANSSQEVLGAPLPEGSRALALTSATDLPLMPGGWRMDVERNACPARVAHPYLPLSPDFAREIVGFLEEEGARECPPWRDWGLPVTVPFGAPPGPG